MKNKRKRDTTVNLSDWDIETRIGYLIRHSGEKVEDIMLLSCYRV